MNTYEDCSVEASNPVYHEKGRRWISVTNASSVDDSDAPALESQSTSPDLRNVVAVETNSLASRRPDASGLQGTMATRSRSMVMVMNLTVEIRGRDAGRDGECPPRPLGDAGAGQVVMNLDSSCSR